MTQIRLNVLCEGNAEQEFVEKILSPHLLEKNIITSAQRVYTKKDRNKITRGGVTKYKKIKDDLKFWFATESGNNIRFTTFIDYYGIPEDFPGLHEEVRITSPYDRIKIMELRFAEDISHDYRFIPYIQLHEFEALLFVEPKRLNHLYFNRESEVDMLEQMLNATMDQNPELINNNKETAPSKRILSLIPEYDKCAGANMLLSEVGLSNLRRSCKHFHEWIDKLENLNNDSV